MADLVQVSDEDCRNKLRMDRSCFYRLCHLLQDVGGLKSSKYINVYEKVAMFLSILAHHSKNRCVKFQFKRSGQTVSKQFHSVLRSVLKLHYLLLVKPTPIPDDSNDTRWGNFKIEWRLMRLELEKMLLREKYPEGAGHGFQRELEKGMHKIFPGTDLVANPHINSKIHVWKKEYSALSDLISKSGIGWNSTTSMIDVEDEGVWEACRLADPQVKGIRFKSWPFYSKWLDIFSKDRATGENAMDPIDLVNDLLRNDNQEQDGDNEDKYNSINPTGVNDAENNTVCMPEGSGKKRISKGIKRKMRDTEITSLVESLGEFMKQSHDTFEDIAKGIGASGEKKIDINHLLEIMNRIVGLKVADKIKGRIVA
ncbi:hypothetical protein ACS0TY_035994 [Phlomoides rotata]